MKQLLVTSIFFALMALPAQAAMLADCNQSEDPNRRIAGCTAVIASGRVSGKNLAAPYSNRGLAYSALGHHGLAIEDFEQAISYHPDLHYGYLIRGVAYQALGQHERSINDFDQAIRLNPNLSAAHYNRGTVYVTLGQHDLAIKDFDEAIRLEPGDPMAYYRPRHR